MLSDYHYFVQTISMNFVTCHFIRLLYDVWLSSFFSLLKKAESFHFRAEEQ